MPGKEKNYRITAHAAFEIERRGLDIAVINRVLSAPEQIHAVVTAYRTSKISKYWRDSQ